MRAIIMAHLVLGSTDASEPIQDLNRVSSSTGEAEANPSRLPNPDFSTVPSSSPPPCTCNTSSTNPFLEHAKTMKAAMRNKTTLLSKIRHRTTHSYEAIWASMSLSLVVTLLVIGVLHSKMWQHRPHVSSMDSQPIKFIQWNPLAEIKVPVKYRTGGRQTSISSGEASVAVPGSISAWNVWEEDGEKKPHLPQDGGVHDSS